MYIVLFQVVKVFSIHRLMKIIRNAFYLVVCLTKYLFVHYIQSKEINFIYNVRFTAKFMKGYV